MIIDLSPSMKERVDQWQRLGHKTDPTLLYQCSYYPRGGCQDCSFDSPKEDCKWSHILIDTRIDPPVKQTIKQVKKNRKINIEVLLSRLPVEVQDEIRKILGGEGETV